MMAVNVLNECQQKDPSKAMMIVERHSPVWNEMTCLQIAAASNDRASIIYYFCFNLNTVKILKTEPSENWNPLKTGLLVKIEQGLVFRVFTVSHVSFYGELTFKQIITYPLSH
jgi:hypothetical protein